MSAVLVLYDQVKEDIQCLDNTTTLLKSIQNFVIVGEDEERMQGAYMYYDICTMIPMMKNGLEA